MSESQKVYISGHRGMVGSALLRRMMSAGYKQLVVRTRAELDLTDQAAVLDFFRRERPDVVVFAAARVGGIHANDTFPAEFLYENLAMAANAIHAAWLNGVRRFLYLGSTCIYPRLAPQPIPEASLLSSPLEPTNEGYAIAKIAGLKLCQYYRQQYGVLFHSAMPTNLYGSGDNYHLENSHVLPSLIRRFHSARMEEAHEVSVWGSGTPLREFLHVDDLASAVLHLLTLDDPPNLVNVGSGEEISIRDLAGLVAEIVGFDGRISLDLTKKDGAPRKLSDTSLIRSTGWIPQVTLREGIRAAYQDFLAAVAGGRLRGS